MSGEPISSYHVLLQGRSMGPYDPRTIIGMRIKNTLTSSDVLIDAEGRRLTVADLLAWHRSRGFDPSRSSAFTAVQAVYQARLLGTSGKGFDLPVTKSEVEIRVQPDVLRVAGRFRRGWRRKDDRVKIPLDAVTRAIARGSGVELWLRPDAQRPQDPPQIIWLRLAEDQEAKDLVGWLPDAVRPPSSTSALALSASAPTGASLVWLAVIGVVFVVSLVAMVLLWRHVL